MNKFTYSTNRKRAEYPREMLESSGVRAFQISNNITFMLAKVDPRLLPECRNGASYLQMGKYVFAFDDDRFRFHVICNIATVINSPFIQI